MTLPCFVRHLPAICMTDERSKGLLEGLGLSSYQPLAFLDGRFIGLTLWDCSTLCVDFAMFKADPASSQKIVFYPRILGLSVTSLVFVGVYRYKGVFGYI